ncbi:MAG: PKD domain-containing protein [Saprospiraceae bacterium]
MKKVVFLFFTFIFGMFYEATSQQWVYLDSINNTPYAIEKLPGDEYVIYVLRTDYYTALIKIDGINGFLLDSLLIASGGMGPPCCYLNDIIHSFPFGQYSLFFSDLTLGFPFNAEIVQYKFNAELEILGNIPIGFGFFSPLELTYDLYQTTDSTMISTGFVDDSFENSPLLVFEFNRLSGEILWSKKYPWGAGGTSEKGTKIIPALDGGYFIAGGRNHNDKPCLVKRITASGQEIWTKYYEGFSGADAVHGGDSSIVITSSGTIFKIDYDGDILWKREVLGCPGETCYFCRKIRKTPDGRYVTIGLKGSYENGQVVNYIGVYFYSEAGEILEKYFFEGTSIYSYNPIDFAPTDDGEYIIVSRLLGDGSMHVMKTNIKDLKPPAAGFSFEANSLEVAFSDTSTFNPTSWHWDFGDGDTSALQHPSHGYAEEGMYEVCLIVSNSNGSDTVCQWVELEVSSTITLPQRPRNLTLFPNPAGDELNLRVSPALAENGEFRLYNVLGQLVKKHPLAAGKNEYRFSLHPLPPACYYYSLSTGQEALAVGKILKQ